MSLDGTFMTADEVEDAWHTLSFAEKTGDNRSLNTCLDILCQHWNQTHNKAIESEILQRIISKQD